MNQNNKGKYLKYAIGEIALVMIGILLALQVNNWNEVRKENILEQVFLQKLRSNLQEDILLYQEVIVDAEEFEEGLDSALIMMQNYEDFNKDDLQKYLQVLMYSSRFITNQTAFNNLSSIGKINVIDNDSITEGLFLYYRRAQIIKESVQSGIDNYNRNTFGPEILSFDYINTPPGFQGKTIKEYAEYPLFMNGIAIKKTMFQLLKRNYLEQIEKAEDIIELINLEIKE
jgi:hypothetical protein